MIIILLPAFNEEQSIAPIFNKLKIVFDESKEDYRIIVCNDGSTDNTQRMLENHAKLLSLEIINHSVNRGLGETIRDLFERAALISLDDDDVIIRIDCDDTHEPKYISSIINKVRSGYDVVIASRFVKGGGQKGVNIYRRFVSSSANLFMKVFFPIKGLKEYSCGYRGYNSKIIKKALRIYGNNFIQLKGLGFTCTLEKLIKLKIIGAKFTEVPFILRYDQKASNSKMISSITTFGYFVITILYYWPFGGWKASYKEKIKKSIN